MESNSDEEWYLLQKKIYKGFIAVLLLFSTIGLIFIIQFNMKINALKEREELISSLVKAKVVNNANTLRQISSRQLNLKLFLSHNSSLILETVTSPSEYQYILSSVNPPDDKLALCYKESVHGSTPKALTSNCLSGIGLIVIIKTIKGNRFGGYLPVLDFMFTTRPFLFSLDSLLYFNLKPNGTTHSIPEGMIIQFGEDIAVAINCTSNNSSFSFFPHDYGNDLYTLSDLMGQAEPHFQVSEMEILTIKDSHE